MAGQALAVDREQVRIIALAVGVREAARQFGLNEDTVAAWSAREGWLKQKQAEETVQQQALERKWEAQGLPQASASTAAEVMKRTGPNTRAKLAIAAEKQAENLAQMDGDELVMMAQTVTTVINGASKLHGWGGDVEVNVRLDVLAGQTQASPVIDID